jgi:phosphoribosyl-ATP pyrophosphohydrolase/phosphoribosyl-AMP cyclohydrolase
MDNCNKVMLDYTKLNGLVPAIIQDASTLKVLMLGFMNEEALQKTRDIGLVTFYSRTKKRLWTKGEESGHFLHVVSIREDCDKDTLLILVNPEGPVCHMGWDTCFNDSNTQHGFEFIRYLQPLLKNGTWIMRRNPIRPLYLKAGSTEWLKSGRRSR